MTDKPETQSEVKPLDATFWLGEIKAAKERLSTWYDKAEEAQDRYDDEKERAFGACPIFWANTETQKAAIGEEFGKPQVTRVNQPEDDGGLSRHIATVWERSITAGVKETKDNHDIGLAVNDIFIPGRGQIWLELEAKEDEAGDVIWVSAPLVRVVYKNFLHGYATRWGDVPWVGRRHLFTRDELVSECKLSDEEADRVPLNVMLPYEDRKGQPQPTAGKEQFKRAAVWEIWTKFPNKLRIYVAEDFSDKVLCAEPDPYRLKDFFPCPRPIIANGDEGRAPLTDYSRYEDQCKEIDEISQRIFVLTATLRRRGIHDKQFKELGDLAVADDNVSFAVDNFADLQNKGGLSAVCQWEDLNPIITVLTQLHAQRSELIQLTYQLTGISDLARGMTDAGETLGAQKLKVTFGSGRFRSREVESRRFAAEAYQLKGEVIAEHFPREQLEEMSGVKLPRQADIDKAKQDLQGIITQQQQAQAAGIPMPPPDPGLIKDLTKTAQARFSWEKIAKVLRSEYRRCYSVEVETDQSQYVDAEADKKSRAEMFVNVTDGLQKIGPFIAGNPKNGEFFKGLFEFYIGGFKAGRSQEEGLSRALDEAIKLAAEQQGQQGQQDPKAAADAQISQLRVKAAEVGLQTAQVRLQQAQVEAQQSGAKIQEQAQEAQLGAVQNQQKAMEGQQKVAIQHENNQAKRAGNQIDLQNKAEKLAFDRETRATATEALLAGPTQAPANGAA